MAQMDEGRLQGEMIAPQIDTAQRRAEASLFLNSLNGYDGACIVDIAQEKDIDRLLAYKQQARREALEEAAKAQCMYCNDPGWEPMSNSGYHQCRESGPSLMRCRATAIHELIDRLREGVEG